MPLPKASKPQPAFSEAQPSGNAFTRSSGGSAREGLLSEKPELCPQKWTFGHTKTDTYRFKEQFHRFETVMPETRYEDDVSH